VKGRAHHARVNPFLRGSAGGSRLEFSTFDREVGVEVNLEIRNGAVTQMCELMLVETESGKAHHVPLREEMTADELRTAIERRAIARPFEARLSCYPHERPWVEELIQEHSPGATFSAPKLMSHIIETPQVKFQLGERYFRGIAKIGFHYFLTQFPTYTGHEAIFVPIRAFIGEETNEPIRHVNDFLAMRNHSLLVPMLDPEVRPDGWRAHVLAAEIRPGACMAHVQMFLSEENPANIYRVFIAKDPAIAGQEAHAHLYRYFLGGTHGRFAGEAIALPPHRVAPTFPPATPAVASH
jgi:hypothetical protein